MDEEHRNQLDFVRNDRSVDPHSIIDIVSQKKTSWRDNEWTLYKKKNGDKVKLSDILDQVSLWIKRFIQIGDTAVQFDSSGHAAIPWLAVKTLLQLPVKYFDAFGSMVEGIEKVSRIITLFPGPVVVMNSSRATQLSASLLKLYRAVLVFLADAHAYFSKNPAKRIWDGLKSMVKDDPMDDIEELESAICKLEHLSVHEYEVRMLKNLDEWAERIEAQVESVEAQTRLIDERTERADRDRIFGFINGIWTKEAYSTALRNRLEGTCEWVQQLEELRAWQSGDATRPKLLWIHGPAGFGKTVLSASITQHLKETIGCPVAYFFCVADNEPTTHPYAILRSWLIQALESPEILVAMQSHLRDRKPGDILTQAELWKLFDDIGSFGCVFVVDGFDECKDIDSGAGYHKHDPRNYFFRDLIQHLPKTRSRILVVSRDVLDVREYLGQDQVEVPGVDMFTYQITASDTAADIKSFSEAMVNKKLPKKPVEVQRTVAFQAAERSDGMFLWIKLLERQISSVQNAKELMATVREMPSGIDEAYARELDKIARLPQKHRDKATMILRWVLFALRPLAVKELVEALIVSEEDLDEYPWDNLPDTWVDSFVDDEYVKERILGRCGSLLRLRSSADSALLATQTVHFVHFSVKEYLLSSGENPEANLLRLAGPAAEELGLCKICLRYLAMDVSKENPSRVELHPFLAYAGWAWYFHGYYGKPKPTRDLIDQTCKIFDPTTSSWRGWASILENEWIRERTKNLYHLSAFGKLGNLSGSPSPSPIYYAAFLGLVDVIEWLANDRGQDINCAGGLFRFPLQAAIAGGHRNAVIYLLDCNVADKQIKSEFDSALTIAAAVATPEVVQLLLAAGADVNADLYGSPLECARQPKINEQLLEHHSKMSSRTKCRALRNPGVFRNGCADVRLRLVHDDATLDIVNSTVDADLALEVMQYKDLETVAAMVDSIPDAAITAPMANGTTLLHCAVQHGALATVQKLLYHPNLARRMSVDCVGKENLTVLQVAVKSAESEAALALRKAIKRSAGVSQDSQLTVLEVVHVLRNAGAGLTGVFQDSQLTLFETAAHKRRRDIAQTLVRYGCFGSEDREATSPTEEEGESLSTVVFLSSGDVAEVSAFLSRGGAPSQDTLDEALRLAAAQGYTSVTTKLLDLGARSAAPDMNGRTALHYAAGAAHVELAEMLLVRGAQSALALEDTIGSTPIDLAIAKGLAANSFIQKHIESHVRRLSQLETNTSASVSPADVCAALPGFWNGDCHGKNGTKNILNLEFPKIDAGKGDHSTDRFSLHTFVDSGGVVLFIYLHSRGGMQFRGQLDADLGKITGTWGRNCDLLWGTFELTRGIGRFRLPRGYFAPYPPGIRKMIYGNDDGGWKQKQLKSYFDYFD